MNPNGRKFYHVTLDPEERSSLRDLVEGGKGSKERRKRAHILLRADRSRDGGGLRDADIANVLGVGTATVERVRKLCVMEGVEAALVRTGQRKEQKNRKRRLLNGKGEATLTRLACSDPPDGRAAWTLSLLGEKLIELDIVETISTETIRRTLKKTRSSRWVWRVEGMRVHSAETQCGVCLCHGGCSGDRPPGL